MSIICRLRYIISVSRTTGYCLLSTRACTTLLPGTARYSHMALKATLCYIDWLRVN